MMELGLFQEQTQRLIMTQQMKQAIQLLQCTSEELNEYLLEELRENPFVEYTPAPHFSDRFVKLRSRNHHRATENRAASSSRAGNPLEQLLAGESTMADTLTQQIRLMSAREVDLKAAIALLGYLDESGYLRCSEAEGWDICGGQQQYEAAVGLVQDCDPAGIGARNLQECLLLQAQAQAEGIEGIEGAHRQLVEAIIRHHLEDVATGRWQLIAKALGESVHDVQSAVDIIRQMNPRPGLNLGAGHAPYVAPEVLVEKADGAYRVLVNDEVQPKVRVNWDYVGLVRRVAARSDALAGGSGAGDVDGTGDRTGDVAGDSDSAGLRPRTASDGMGRRDGRGATELHDAGGGTDGTVHGAGQQGSWEERNDRMKDSAHGDRKGSGQGSTHETYLKRHLQTAQWLTKSLDMRRTTLYRVAEAIVRVQQSFFEEGPTGLRPLTLHQVAEDVEMHESTISRTVRGKYMQTPRGVFELKYFFTAEIQGEGGTVSAESVKYLLRQLIDSEDAQHPYSDEVLCQQMSHQGIRISRRTVAKYRDELRIPSSSKRRRFM